jgi:CTP synthase (UTP-ammonia lyase)
MLPRHSFAAPNALTCRAMTGSPRIAIVGDYSELKETHRAIDAELSAADVEYAWIPTTAVDDPALTLADCDGLLIASGSPYASMDGALAAIRFARERGLPLVGTCGGFQHVVLEFARDVLGIEDADHAETNPGAERFAVTPLECSLAGQSHWVRFALGSRVASIYGVREAVEAYFCSYGLNPELEPRFGAAGLRVSGRDEHGGARVVELDGHPFFVATLYVFQVRFDRTAPHPLTAAFLEAAAGHAHDRRLRPAYLTSVHLEAG